MDRSSCVAAIGSSATAVVADVCRLHGKAPTRALSELALATNCHGSGSVDAWFTAMQRRYSAARGAWRDSDAGCDAHSEVSSVVAMVAPSGCSVSELDGVAASVNGMLTRSAPAAILDAHLGSFTASQASASVRISAAVLSEFFVSGPLFDSSMDRAWWLEDADLETTYTRLALRAVPATLLIEYRLPAGGGDELRHRQYELDGHVRETGSVLPVAKKLAKRTGVFGLAEGDVVRLLTKLQKLMQDAQVDPDDADLDPTVRAYAAGATTSAAPATTKAPSAAPSSGKGGSDEPQKADLGLLYRDPDAALKNVDLQDADDVVVKEFKSKMDEKFKDAVLKPGDPGYEYDKRTDFKPTEKSEWDDSDED